MAVTRLACEFHLRLTQLLFGPFSVLDLDTGSIPLNDVSPFIAQRHVADQQPAIIPILPPNP
jgi:hypothetical protein